MRNHYFSQHKSETSSLVWDLGVMIDPAFEEAEWFPGLLPIWLNRGKVNYTKDGQERIEAIKPKTTERNVDVDRVVEGVATGAAYTALAAVGIPYVVIMGSMLLVLVGGFWMFVALLIF